MWTFSCPTIVYGDNALDYILNIKDKSALIVTDKKIVRLGLSKRVTDQLDAAKIQWRIFDEIDSALSLKTVMQAGNTVGDYHPDWVIGLGGSACMSAAKAITKLLTRPNTETKSYPGANLKQRRGKAKLMAIPTTNGSGAEATYAICLTDTENQSGLPMENNECAPDVAIIDPEMVIGAPPQVIADSGMDVICKAIEGYISTCGHSITDGPALIAARQVFASLPSAFANRDDVEARMEMQHAAILAGLSAGSALAGLSQSAGHALSAIHPISPIQAAGLLLPYTMEYLINGSIQSTAKYAEIARFCGITANSDMACAQSLVARVRALARQVEHPQCIKDCGIEKEQFEASIPALIDWALNEAVATTARRVPGQTDMENIFRYAYWGKPIDF